jgi:Fe-Mn family superoxide dismutase
MSRNPVHPSSIDPAHRLASVRQTEEGAADGGPSRRAFLHTASLALGSLAASRTLGAAQPSSGAPTTVVPGEAVLPPLPYPADALEPYIDTETMTLHHDKHHAAYVNGLNAAEKALADARGRADFDLVQHWSRQAAFNGGGHFLHSLFWQTLAPAGKGGGGEPKGALLERIVRDFGSFDSLKKHFSAAAIRVEGSGWALLHVRASDGKLLVLQAENQHKLSPWGATPILGVDVWEHAYYLKYRNRRADYVEAWWNVVNWGAVQKSFEALQS